MGSTEPPAFSFVGAGTTATASAMAASVLSGAVVSTASVGPAHNQPFGARRAKRAGGVFPYAPCHGKRHAAAGCTHGGHLRNGGAAFPLLGVHRHMQAGDVRPQRVHALGGRSGILHAEQVCHHAAPTRMRLAHNPLYGLISGEGHHGHDVCPCLARHGAQAGAAVHDLHIGKNGHAEARARKFFHSGKAVAQHKAGAHLYNIRILPRRSRKAHGLVQRAPLLCAVQRQLQRHMRRLLP